jgi:hypothetical protein
MKKSYKTLIIEYNHRLAECGQSLFVCDWIEGMLVLSTGVTLNAQDIRNFRSHIKSPMLQKRLDELYIINVDRPSMIKEIQRKYASDKNKEWWKTLDPTSAEQKRSHMRSIQKLVDHSAIVMPEPWNKGKTKHTDSRLEKNSKARTGDKNPMYGTRWTEAQKQEKSEWVKSRIESGEWTPHAHNSRTHWNCSYNGKHYRSSWEVIYAALNVDDLYETVRIPYVIDGKRRIYIVDFFNPSTKTITEVKPLIHTTDAVVEAKTEAAIEWCNTQGYKFRVVSEQYFVDNYDSIPFNELTIPNVREKLARIKSEASK